MLLHLLALGFAEAFGIVNANVVVVVLVVVVVNMRTDKPILHLCFRTVVKAMVSSVG